MAVYLNLIYVQYFDFPWKYKLGVYIIFSIFVFHFTFIPISSGVFVLFHITVFTEVLLAILLLCFLGSLLIDPLPIAPYLITW